MRKVLLGILGAIVAALLVSLELNWNYQRQIYNGALSKPILERVVRADRPYDLNDLFAVGTPQQDIAKSLTAEGFTCDAGDKILVCKLPRQKYVLSVCDDRLAVVTDFDATGRAIKTEGELFLTCL